MRFPPFSLPTLMRGASSFTAGGVSSGFVSEGMKKSNVVQPRRTHSHGNTTASPCPPLALLWALAEERQLKCWVLPPQGSPTSGKQHCKTQLGKGDRLRRLTKWCASAETPRRPLLTRQVASSPPSSGRVTGEGHSIWRAKHIRSSKAIPLLSTEEAAPGFDARMGTLLAWLHTAPWAGHDAAPPATHHPLCTTDLAVSPRWRLPPLQRQYSPPPRLAAGLE